MSNCAGRCSATIRRSWTVSRAESRQLGADARRDLADKEICSSFERLGFSSRTTKCVAIVVIRGDKDKGKVYERVIALICQIAFPNAAIQYYDNLLEKIISRWHRRFLAANCFRFYGSNTLYKPTHCKPNESAASVGSYYTIVPACRCDA